MSTHAPKTIAAKAATAPFRMCRKGSNFMQKLFRGLMVVTALTLAAATALAQAPAGGQAAPAYRAPRTADGRPNLNGIWQAVNEANWDLLPHAANFGRVVALGTEDAVPPGIGWVEGGEIPYLPAAAAKKKENYEKRLTLDPEIKCYLPGVPRAMYMPF